MTTRPPKIFISYSWATKNIAQSIYDSLAIVGISVLKDNNEIKYTDRISKFMDKIRDCDFALLLISDAYLKSKNCMYEVLQLLKEKNVWDKILPVIVVGTKISKVQDRIDYVNFWQQETITLEQAIENIDPINAIEIQKDIKIYREITSTIDEFIKTISDMKYSSPEELFDQNYTPILERISFFDDKKLVELLEIALEKDFEKKEVKLEEYLTKHGPSSAYYSLKGGVFRQQRKFELAKHYFLKANELDEFNVESQNNLGQIYELLDKNYPKARECYEKAIIGKPDFDIPRLNLGVLLSHHFNDDEGAKEQYEKILEFDPSNAKAHNNLCNYYKRPGKLNLEKAEFHILKAIDSNPKYVEAYINYGNMLKVYKGEIEKGNEYYLKAKSLDKEGRYKDFIDTLINSKKG